MRHALAGVRPVLDRDIEARGAVDALDHAPDAGDGGEEVGCLGRGEVTDAGDGADGADEDVAGEEGLEVHEAEG